jgi:hypothetical protein
MNQLELSIASFGERNGLSDKQIQSLQLLYFRYFTYNGTISQIDLERNLRLVCARESIPYK